MNARIEDENIQGMAQPTLAEQAKRAAEDLHAREQQLKERGKQAANRLTAALDTARVQVKEKTVASARATDRAIRDYPYPTLGVAFGIGVVLGVLIARR
jgi:ElaB/YqjD/DUF883 family membrane-anchored ribosome-binding protein